MEQGAVGREPQQRIDYGKLGEEKRSAILHWASQSQHCMRKEIVRLEALKDELMNSGGRQGLVCGGEKMAGLGMGWSGVGQGTDGGCLCGCDGGGLFRSLHHKQDGLEVMSAPGMYPETRLAVHTYPERLQDGWMGSGEHGDDFHAPMIYVREPHKGGEQSLQLVRQPYTQSSNQSRKVRKRHGESHFRGGTSTGQVTLPEGRRAQMEDMSESLVEQFKDLIVKHSEVSANTGEPKDSSTRNRISWSHQLLVMRRLRDSFHQVMC